MRAVSISHYGGPEVLEVKDLPEPAPKTGEVLVRTIAAGINPVDWKTRIGMVGEPKGGLPTVLGWDLAGVVISSTVADFAAGDRVIAMTAQPATGIGSWSDVVATPASWLTPAPRSTSLVEAGTLPLAGLTARQALDKLELKPGERLLVAGGAGAVGSLAIQLALRDGVQVDALVSRPSHREAVLELGVGSALHDPADLDAQTYDAVFDTAGADVSASMRSGARFVTISDDPLPDLTQQSATPMRSYVQQDTEGLAELVDLVNDGELRLRVASTFSVNDVRRAHEHFECGGLIGKVVLTF